MGQRSMLRATGWCDGRTFGETSPQPLDRALTALRLSSHAHITALSLTKTELVRKLQTAITTGVSRSCVNARRES
jgi:hypothetical protein